jgi:hypothetical protein
MLSSAPIFPYIFVLFTKTPSNRKGGILLKRFSSSYSPAKNAGLNVIYFLTEHKYSFCMPEEIKQQTALGDVAARQLAIATRTVPQMITITPRWLTHLLSWIPVESG